MTENFIFSYKKIEKKIEDSIFYYSDLIDKFISTFGLKEDIKTEFKFFINGKEIMENDDIMDIIKPDDIIEVKNINEKEEAEDEELKEEIKEKEPEEDLIKDSNLEEKNISNESNKEELTKNLDDILSAKFEENNQKIEKIISEKIIEKMENLKTELTDIMEEKIKNCFSENEINQKIIDINNKLSQLNQDYIDFKSIKIKYFNKFIEFLDNKSGPQDTIKNEPNDSSKRNEDIEKLKENNNKLKDLIKKYKKEKDDLKEKLEKESTNKGNSANISKQIEKLKKENEDILLENKKLNEEKKNLNIKIKKLENDLKKKSDKSELTKSFSESIPKKLPKKYVCQLNPDKNELEYTYKELKENNIIEFNINIKNKGEDDLPKSCEIILINDIKGLSLNKNKTKTIIKESDVLQLKFTVDLESINLNQDICIKLKLIDDKKKDIEGAKCELKIKIIKEEEIAETEEPTKNNIFLEENDYNDLFDYINEILSIETVGEDLSSFKKKLSDLLKNKKEKYEGITEKTQYIETLKEDLEEVFQI